MDLYTYTKDLQCKHPFHTIKYKRSPISLRFKDSSLEKRFRGHLSSTRGSHTRITTALLGFMFIVIQLFAQFHFSFTDPFVYFLIGLELWIFTMLCTYKSCSPLYFFAVFTVVSSLAVTTFYISPYHGLFTLLLPVILLFTSDTLAWFRGFLFITVITIINVIHVITYKTSFQFKATVTTSLVAFVLLNLLLHRFAEVQVRKFWTEIIELGKLRKRSSTLLKMIMPIKAWNKDLSAFQCDNSCVIFVEVVGIPDVDVFKAPSEYILILNRIFNLIEDLAKEYGVSKLKTVQHVFIGTTGVDENLNSPKQSKNSKVKKVMITNSELSRSRLL
ncbi:hypothetical protein GEMRC1_009761 [Eukaryota sp. GEM-RC1]